MAGLGAGYEIIYVDDGSTDSSSEILNKLRSGRNNLKVISFKENRGKGAGLEAGFKEAVGDWIVTLDADLQNPPEEISGLVRFRDGFDYIIGIRLDRKDSVLKKSAASVARLFRRVVLGDITTDAGCGLRLFKKDVLSSVPHFRNFFIYLTYLARKKGYSVKEVGIRHDRRMFGKSKYGILKRAVQGWGDLWTARKAIDR